jgi:IPT/TIG domain
MRRIAFALTLLVVVALLHACAADAPTVPGGGGGGGGSSALQIQLFTSDANPKAGSCTLIEAVVTLNGNPVPDGTGVSFTTDFGTFSQNGLPSVSVVTTNDSAVTALCGSAAGPAKVHATATVAGKTGSASLTIVFQPDQSAGPVVLSCSPSLGSTSGGDSITLNGARFTGTVATTRVQFTAGGITRDGLVTSVSANAITVTTPAFPELSAPNTPTQVTVTLGTNQPTPTALSLPNCFAFGTTASNVPTITALLPSQGTKEGGTRVTIIGSGFSTAGVQVFFGPVEATVISTTFSQIIVLSPKNFGAGEQTVPVTVKNIGSGTVSGPVNFRYTPAVTIVSASNTTQPAIGPFSAVTIFGQGFQAPVAVSLAGIPASAQSVSATELVVIPGQPLVGSCSDISGPIRVVNINTGDGAESPDTLVFHYVVEKPTINGVSPANSCPTALPTDPCPNGGTGGIPVTITGGGFSSNVELKFGSQIAFQAGAHTSSSIPVTAPITSATPPTCVTGNLPGTHQVVSTVDVTVTNIGSSCSVTASQAFQYIMPCVAAGP